MELAQRLLTYIPRPVRWLAVASWMGLLFYLSSLTGTSMPGRFASLAHFSMYAILGALLWIALEGSNRPILVVALAVMIASLYGISDEIHQSFVPGRTPEVADWGFDTIGALTGAIVMAVIAGRGARKHPFE